MSVSILELAERVRKLTGSDSPIEMVPYGEAYAPGFEDMRRRVPSTARIEALLGWQPSRALDEILEDVISWERERAGERRPAADRG